MKFSKVREPFPWPERVIHYVTYVLVYAHKIPILPSCVRKIPSENTSPRVYRKFKFVHHTMYLRNNFGMLEAYVTYSHGVCNVVTRLSVQTNFDCSIKITSTIQCWDNKALAKHLQALGVGHLHNTRGCRNFLEESQLQINFRDSQVIRLQFPEGHFERKWLSFKFDHGTDLYVWSENCFW